MQIPLSLSATQDKLIWIHDRNGRFSVKSCYHLLQTDFNNVPTDENFLWKKIWSLFEGATQGSGSCLAYLPWSCSNSRSIARKACCYPPQIFVCMKELGSQSCILFFFARSLSHVGFRPIYIFCIMMGLTLEHG